MKVTSKRTCSQSFVDRVKTLVPGIAVIALVVLATVIPASAEPEGLDTTRVRETKKIKKSFGEHVANLPGDILKLPMRVLDVVGHSASTNPPFNYVPDIIRYARKFRRYSPIVDYNTRSGFLLGFGTGHQISSFLEDQLTVSLSYSTNNYQDYRLTYHANKFLAPRFGLGVYAYYRKQTRERFFGVGNESDRDNKGNYSSEVSSFGLMLPYNASKVFILGLNLGYHASNFFDGEDPNRTGSLDSLSADSVFGLKDGQFDGSRFYAFGGSIVFDNRDSRGQTRHGGRLELALDKFVGIDQSENLDFIRASFTASQYLHIYRGRVLAFRVQVQRNDADDNQLAVPVNLITQLGGGESLRGYETGRFIDNDLALVSAEYRYPVFEVVDGFIFIDEGRVYEDIDGARIFDGWKYSAGFGLRLFDEERVIVRTQVAHSEESTRFYFQLGATW